MTPELEGKTALVTGSSRGIGRAIAEELHANGCRIAINARTREDLDVVANALPGSSIVCGDVSDPDESSRVVMDAMYALGKIDILVCNVGSGRSVAPGEEKSEEWQRMFSQNLWSATNMVEAARDALVATKGAIVCISSICGSEVVPGAPVTYSVAKAALNAFVRGIARPLGKQGVRINAVAPGNILFDGSVWSRKLAADSAGVEDMLQKNVALGKLGSPEDVAHLVAYLVSPRGRFVTGAVWTVDGGQVRS